MRCLQCPFQGAGKPRPFRLSEPAAVLQETAQEKGGLPTGALAQQQSHQDRGSSWAPPEKVKMHRHNQQGLSQADPRSSPADRTKRCTVLLNGLSVTAKNCKQPNFHFITPREYIEQEEQKNPNQPNKFEKQCWAKETWVPQTGKLTSVQLGSCLHTHRQAHHSSENKWRHTAWTGQGCLCKMRGLSSGRDSKGF